jgi:hypothetical protein
MNTNNQNFKRFHDAYRAQRALGLTKILALERAKRENSTLYKAYCIGQENGEAWTREPLDAKDPVRLAQIIQTGRLI